MDWEGKECEAAVRADAVVGRAAESEAAVRASVLVSVGIKNILINEMC